MLGTNDTKAMNWNAEAYAQDIGKLIENYHGLESRPQVFLLLPPPVFPFCGKVRWDIRSEVLENELLPICRRVAEEKGVPVIDVIPPSWASPSFSWTAAIQMREVRG